MNKPTGELRDLPWRTVTRNESLLWPYYSTRDTDERIREQTRELDSIPYEPGSVAYSKQTILINRKYARPGDTKMMEHDRADFDRRLGNLRA